MTLAFGQGNPTTYVELVELQITYTRVCSISSLTLRVMMKSAKSPQTHLARNESPFVMKMVLFPAVDEARLTKIREAAGGMIVVNAASEAEAKQEIADACAFFGKITPELLALATKLEWVQSPTASLEH